MHLRICLCKHRIHPIFSAIWWEVHFRAGHLQGCSFLQRLCRMRLYQLPAWAHSKVSCTGQSNSVLESLCAFVSVNPYPVQSWWVLRSSSFSYWLFKRKFNYLWLGRIVGCCRTLQLCLLCAERSSCLLASSVPWPSCAAATRLPAYTKKHRSGVLLCFFCQGVRLV